MRRFCLMLLAGACLALSGCARTNDDVSLESPRRDTTVEAPYKMYPYSANLGEDKSLTGRTVTPDESPIQTSAQAMAITVEREDFLAALEQTAAELHRREDLTEAEQQRLEVLDDRIARLVEMSAELSADLRELDRATAVR